MPVLVLTPWLSSLWLGLITPVHARIGRRLIEGLSASSVSTDNTGAYRFSVRPKAMAEAIGWALAEEIRRVEQGSWRLLLPRAAENGDRYLFLINRDVDNPVQTTVTVKGTVRQVVDVLAPGGAVVSVKQVNWVTLLKMNLSAGETTAIWLGK